MKSKDKRLSIKPHSLRLFLSAAIFNVVALQSAHSSQQETYLVCDGLSTIATKTHVQKPQTSDLTFSVIKSELSDDQVIMKWWGYEYAAEVSTSKYLAIVPADSEGKFRAFIALNRLNLQVHALVNYNDDDVRYQEFKGRCSIADNPKI